MKTRRCYRQCRRHCRRSMRRHGGALPKKIVPLAKFRRYPRPKWYTRQPVPIMQPNLRPPTPEPEPDPAPPVLNRTSLINAPALQYYYVPTLRPEFVKRRNDILADMQKYPEQQEELQQKLTRLNNAENVRREQMQQLDRNKHTMTALEISREKKRISNRYSDAINRDARNAWHRHRTATRATTRKKRKRTASQTASIVASSAQRPQQQSPPQPPPQQPQPQQQPQPPQPQPYDTFDYDAFDYDAFDYDAFDYDAFEHDNFNMDLDLFDDLHQV